MLRLAVALFAFILAFPVGFLGGVVLSDFWGWFVTPTFTTLPEITSLQGWGVMMVVGLLNVGNSVNMGIIIAKQGKSSTSESDILTPLVTVTCIAIFYLLSWAIGWFVYAAFVG